MEIHPIGEDHEHISFTYFANPVSGNLRININEHDELKWFSEKELDSNNILIEVKTFAKQAIDEVK